MHARPSNASAMRKNQQILSSVSASGQLHMQQSNVLFMQPSDWASCTPNHSPCYLLSPPPASCQFLAPSVLSVQSVSEVTNLIAVHISHPQALLVLLEQWLTLVCLRRSSDELCPAVSAEIHTTRFHLSSTLRSSTTNMLVSASNQILMLKLQYLLSEYHFKKHES